MTHATNWLCGLPALLALVGCGATDPTGSLPDAPPAEELPADATTPLPDATPCAIPEDAMIEGRLTVTADDRRRVWLNGALVSDTAAGWHEPVSEVVMLSRRGTNVLAIEGTNLQTIDGADRGILADLRVELPDGTIATGAEFRVAPSAPTGWEQPGFDDAGWAVPFVIGGATVAPWGDVFAAHAPSSTASWIWTYDPAVPAATKPNADTTYARRTFRFAAENCP